MPSTPDEPDRGDETPSPGIDRRRALQIVAGVTGVAAVGGIAWVATGRTSSPGKGEPDGPQTTRPGETGTDRPAGPAPTPTASIVVADRNNNAVRLVKPDGGVTTLAGGTYGTQDGIGSAAQFSFPCGVVVTAGDTTYVSDQGANLIRSVDRGGMVTTWAGSSYGLADGSGRDAQFSTPYGLAVTSTGGLVVADSLNHRIRAITPEGAVTTLAGSERGYADGVAADAMFDEPSGVAIGPDGTIYVADRANHRIRAITPAGQVTTLAGHAEPGIQDGARADAGFNRPTGIAVDGQGQIWVADCINHRIRTVTPDGVVSTVAGSGEPAFADGRGATAAFHEPCGVAIDPSGIAYVADRKNHRIRTVTPDGEVSTLAGDSQYGSADGSGREARFDEPYGIAVVPT